MYVFDLIDECESILGVIHAQAEVLSPQVIRKKVEHSCQILNQIRTSVTKFDCNPSDIRGL